MVEKRAEWNRGVNRAAAQTLEKANYSGDKVKMDLATPYFNLEHLNNRVAKAAFVECRQTIKAGSKGFYFSTLFLPPEKRQAIWAVYNFCRQTDDLVDRGEGTKAEIENRLFSWEEELSSSYKGNIRSDRSFLLAWYLANQKFNIPLKHYLELVEGVRMDLTKTRYANFEELRLYCYRVASTVGLMASEVIGYTHHQALDYAIELGIAMQLTNILRDVGEDLRAGRIYLPQDEISRFGYSEEELQRGVINKPFIELMQFQIARARNFYSRALPGIEYLQKDCRLAISVAARQYSRILNHIEENLFDVFNLRACVPLNEKIRCLSSVWFSRRFRPPLLPNGPGHLFQGNELSQIIVPGYAEEAEA